MRLPDGVTLHWQGRQYNPGDEIPREAEGILPDHVRAKVVPPQQPQPKQDKP